MKKNLRAGACFMVLLLSWGLLYPQYALTEDMYRALRDGRPVAKDCAADYVRIASAKPGEVEIRLSLLDKLEEWFGENKTYEATGERKAAGGSDRRF